MIEISIEDVPASAIRLYRHARSTRSDLITRIIERIHAVPPGYALQITWPGGTGPREVNRVRACLGPCAKRIWPQVEVHARQHIMVIIPPPQEEGVTHAHGE